jgi:hypothetical protein
MKVKTFKIIFLMAFLHVLTQVSNVAYELLNGSSIAVLKVLIGSIPLAFIGITVAKYIFFVIVINAQLNQIKNFLEKILMGRNFCGLIQVLSKRSKPEVLFEVKMKNLLKIYNLIYENSRLVNESMGLTTLVIIFIIVVTITGTGYKIFLLLVGKFDAEKAGGQFIAFIITSFMLFLMVYVCNWTDKLVSNL